MFYEGRWRDLDLCWHIVLFSQSWVNAASQAPELSLFSATSASGGQTEISWKNSSSFSMLWNTKRTREDEGNSKQSIVGHTGAGQCLTVRLLIPSENAPICLTVPSESSICQTIFKQMNQTQNASITSQSYYSWYFGKKLKWKHLRTCSRWSKLSS